jgi:hypothetical protein
MQLGSSIDSFPCFTRLNPCVAHCSTDSIPWVHHSRKEGSLDYVGGFVRLQIHMNFDMNIHRQQFLKPVWHVLPEQKPWFFLDSSNSFLVKPQIDSYVPYTYFCHLFMVRNNMSDFSKTYTRSKKKKRVDEPKAFLIWLRRPVPPVGLS